MNRDDVISHEKAMEFIREEIGADLARHMNIAEHWHMYDWMQPDWIKP